MAAVDVVGQVHAIANRVAASYGLEIFDVQFRREGGGMVLRVRIDRPGPAATAEESVSGLPLDVSAAVGASRGPGRAPSRTRRS